MKKIVIDARMINSSGIGRYLRAVLSAMGGTPYHMVAVGNKTELEKTIPGYFEDVVNFDRSVYDPRAYYELSFAIPECDLYFSPHFTIPMIRPRARKIMSTIHDLFHLDPVSHFGLIKQAYSRSMIISALRMSDTLLTVSEFTKKEMQKLVPGIGYKTRIVYNAIDTTVFHPDNMTMSPYSFPYVLFVGNLKPHKNLKTAVAAIKRIRHTDVKLIIIGTDSGFIHGMNRHELETIACEEVIMLGTVPDAELRMLYSHAICLVFPSLYEGFGLPPLEAMACGCPVVCSDIPSLKETCKNAALYTAAMDASGFSSHIEKILDNPNLTMELVSRGYSRSEQFSVDRFKNAIRNAFGECL